MIPQNFVRAIRFALANGLRLKRLLNLGFTESKRRLSKTHHFSEGLIFDVFLTIILFVEAMNWIMLRRLQGDRWEMGLSFQSISPWLLFPLSLITFPFRPMKCSLTCLFLPILKYGKVIPHLAFGCRCFVKWIKNHKLRN